MSLATLGGGGAAMVVASEPAAAATSNGPNRTVTTPIDCTVGTTPTTCLLQLTRVYLDGSRNLVADGNVISPTPLTGGATSVPFTAVPITDPPGCHVLGLTLGPLHLDLLGLVVDLNQVNLNITAQPGPGNLLGNLLCAVTNLLNNTGGLGAALTNLLNTINGILAGL